MLGVSRLSAKVNWSRKMELLMPNVCSTPPSGMAPPVWAAVKERAPSLATKTRWPPGAAVYCGIV